MSYDTRDDLCAPEIPCRVCGDVIPAGDEGGEVVISLRAEVERLRGAVKKASTRVAADCRSASRAERATSTCLHHEGYCERWDTLGILHAALAGTAPQVGADGPILVTRAWGRQAESREARLRAQGFEPVSPEYQDPFVRPLAATEAGPGEALDDLTLSTLGSLAISGGRGADRDKAAARVLREARRARDAESTERARADRAERDARMYREAWVREMGGVVPPKVGGLIDSLVAATKALRERADRAEVERDEALSGEQEQTQRAESAEKGCEIAYQREPTQAEGDAHEGGPPSERDGECFVPMGGWTGRRCRACARWTWGGPTICARCAALAACREREGRAMTDRPNADRRFLLAVQARADAEREAELRSLNPPGLRRTKGKGLGKGKVAARVLNREKAEEIRRRAAAGEPPGDLAKAFEVSRYTIGDILRNHTWR
jgi:hypothetical protein